MSLGRVWGVVFPGGSDSKESTCNAGNLGSIPGSGRTPGGGNVNPVFLPGEFITDLMDMSLSKHQELVMDRKPGMLQSMGSQRVGHD